MTQSTIHTVRGVEVLRTYTSEAEYIDALDIDGNRWARRPLRADAFDIDRRDLPRGF